jgi:hypothetical protein
VGVEPTGDTAEVPSNGFEDRANHRARCTPILPCSLIPAYRQPNCRAARHKSSNIGRYYGLIRWWEEITTLVLAKPETIASVQSGDEVSPLCG